MAFTRAKRNATSYATPGELYHDLPRRPGAVPGLWSHQSHMLKAYTDNRYKSDLALELPTGTGKTLTGLLIAEWNRQKNNERVLYACPTRQLAEQVRSAANREGIKVALLTGPHASWNQNSVLQYESAQSIGVTTYSSIFNSHPRLPEPSVILFDDAHAGEQYVGEAYSVNLNRYNDENGYHQILNAVSPALDNIFLERLTSTNPDPGIGDEVRLILPLRQPGMTRSLNEALSTLAAPHSYRYTMIRQGMTSCLVYLSYYEILIRPYIPPTHLNRLFEQARQRIYLSATLGDNGELERAFGRRCIERLCEPDKSIAPRSGRRFFIFPEFVPNCDVPALCRNVATKAGKALVLSQRASVAMADAQELAPPDWPIFGIEDVSTDMSPFIEAKHAICALAARYDGLDLPDDSCRLIVFDNKPDRLNLQEHFLQKNAQAGVALDARIRTRIIQGTGRCTRGPEDSAIVLIRGNLSGYLVRPETLDSLAPEMQAEIRFGLENSQDGTEEDMLENVESFLQKDEDEIWRNNAEPTIVDYRREATQIASPGSEQLRACAGEEVDAWISASTGSWREAALHAHAVGNALGSGDKATRRYQAFWKYLEAAWTDALAHENGDPSTKSSARQLIRDSLQLAGRGSWVHQMAQFPELNAPTLERVDNIAISMTVATLQGNLNEGKCRKLLDKMCADLSESEPGKFEPALSSLGQMLGADASKPAMQGRCDSTWCWGDELWLALEAKSKHKPTGVVPLKDLEQSNDQLTLLAADRDCRLIPPDSATVIISPKPGIHRDGVTIARDNVFLVHPDTIRTIAADTKVAWEHLLAARVGISESDLYILVTKTLQGYGILPSEVRNRLTTTPIGQVAAIPEN